jgi:sec-independent protein translocase protein TatA
MLGLDNPVHLLVVLAVLLLVFGAKRLPEMGRSLGEGLRGFKESITSESNQAEVTVLTRETETVEQPARDRATT